MNSIAPLLIRITGLVTGLQTSQSSENFVFESGHRAAGSAAAVGLAMGGLAGAATGAAMSSGDAADKVTVFLCQVGDQRVTGRFGEVGFTNDDVVEVVGSVQSHQLHALAVTRPADRTIWMHPHCSRGTKAYKQFCWRWIPALSFLTPTVMFAAANFFSSTESPPWWFEVISISAAAVMLGLILFLLAKRFYSFAVLSSEIFASLQFDKPESVDLPKRLSTATKTMPPEDKQRYHPWHRWVYKY